MRRFATVEEFCLLMPETDSTTAAQVLESFRRQVETTELQYGGERLKVTISVGIATFPADADSRQGLFEAADRALYGSKDRGRNRVTLFQKGTLQPIDPSAHAACEPADSQRI